MKHFIESIALLPFSVQNAWQFVNRTFNAVNVAGLIELLIHIRQWPVPNDPEDKQAIERAMLDIEDALHRCIIELGPVTHNRRIWWASLPARTGMINSHTYGGKAEDLTYTAL